MPANQEITRLEAQERGLRWRHFDLGTAWELGQALRAAAQARGAALTIEVRLLGQTAFASVMPGTTPANADWARRKRNTVELLHSSSYLVGLRLARDGTSLEARMGLATRDHAAHGGCVPIVVDGLGCVGNATVSGLPQREDHELVVEVMAALIARQG